MTTEIIKFLATDGIKLDGILNKCDRKTSKVLIQIHGMTSNCFKKRDELINKKVSELGIDCIRFNNRGSQIIKYISNDKITMLGGTAYENLEECYCDILGAINFAIKKGYKEIYLQGHSLGSTKIVYTYNKMQDEGSQLVNNIKGIILLSLVDIPGVSKLGVTKESIDIASKKEKNGQIMDLMPLNSFIHPISVKNFLKLTKYNKDIDFAKYDSPEDEFKVLNSIKCPLFMRWGNKKELINQDAKELAEFMNKKIKNEKKDINFIDGADHSYREKEEILAEEIKEFLKKWA